MMFAITVPMLEGGAEGEPDAAYYTLKAGVDGGSGRNRTISTQSRC
jgi:hypothetical protein